MAKKTVRVATGHFFCWMGLMAVVCVPSFIAGVAYTKPGKPVALLSAPVAGLERDFISLSKAAECVPAEQPGRLQIAEVLDNGGALEANPLGTSFDSPQEALEWGVK
ncbi:MAG: hypothetical protein AMJ65_07400 [Phycisphaerae bacterium SG8_4]|nr:MAG: hypothetical protein AMJ65_07400 [Phycisphaerae bacterium SG8_4]